MSMLFQVLKEARRKEKTSKTALMNDEVAYVAEVKADGQRPIAEPHDDH